MISDASYYEWKRQTLGSDREIWHDGLDTGALTRLSVIARQTAVAYLEYGMSLSDPHAAEAMAAMTETHRRADILTMLERSGDAAERVQLALAAHQLAPDPTLAYELQQALRDADWATRIKAAIGLRHFQGHTDEAALLDAIAADPEYLVRYHAAESLLARWRVSPAELAAHRQILELLVDPPEGPPAPPSRLQRARIALLQRRP